VNHRSIKASLPMSAQSIGCLDEIESFPISYCLKLSQVFLNLEVVFNLDIPFSTP